MENYRFKFKQLIIIISATCSFLITDPLNFALKLGERVRQDYPNSKAARSFNRLIYRAARRQENNFLHQEFQRGNFSKVFESDIKHFSLIGLGLKKKARRSRAMLNLEIDGNSGISDCLAEDSEPRVLYYLTNSLPHTNSGYTIRSQSLAEALIESGLFLIAATRTNYPLVVGRFARSNPEVLNRVSYFRIIPALYRHSELKRLQQAATALADLCQQNDINIIHTTTPFENALVAAKAASMMKIPWIYEARGEPESTWLSRTPKNIQQLAKSSEYYRLARMQETKSMQAANAVVALSEVSRSRMVERGIPESKIRVIPNGVQQNLFDKALNIDSLKKELKLPSGPLIGTVSSLVDYEGLDTLLRAVPYLDEQVRVVIVGDGVARPKLEELSQKLGVSERVFFYGRKPSEVIWKWYSCLDVFIIPRKDVDVCRYVTPIKPLSAMAVGVPVVASDLPALREVTGGLATYFNAGDPTQLAQAVQETLNHPPDPEIIQTWAKSRSWEKLAVGLTDTYKRLLHDNYSKQ